MIGYVTLGTDNLKAAAAFYDALLGSMGAKRFMENERLVIWATAPGAPMLGLITPFDGRPASVGNGTMVALAGGSRKGVDSLYARALALGATDEGAPGERIPGFYAGYFRDPEGNKLNVFHMG